MNYYRSYSWFVSLSALSGLGRGLGGLQTSNCTGLSIGALLTIISYPQL